MSRNIFVALNRSSSRIIPGQSILINSNHQSSNIEGKRRNLCTLLFSLFLFLFLSGQTRVHTRVLSTSIYLGSFLTPIRPRIPLFRPFCFKPVLAFPHKRRSLELYFRCTCLYSINSTFYTILHVVDFFPLQKWILSIPRGFSFRKFHDDWLGNSERG